MAIRVDFYKLDWDKAEYFKCASLTWDGTRFTGSPKGSMRLQHILNTRVIHGGKAFTAQDDPVAFMEGLHKQYRGPRSYATPAYDPAKGDPALQK